MIRVIINWNNHFKLFKRVSGTVEIHETTSFPYTEVESIITATIFSEEGMLGYENIEIHNKKYTSYFELIKPFIDLAIRSYQEGFKASERSVFWCARKEEDTSPKWNHTMLIISE